MIYIYVHQQKADNHDGTFVMETGEEDIYRTAHILSWEGKTQLSNWNNETEGDFCNMINGTDSSYYRPFRTPGSENLFVFNTDVCR